MNAHFLQGTLAGERRFNSPRLGTAGEGSFLSVSTPSPVKDVEQRELEAICDLVSLGDPKFFFAKSPDI